jgi:hypothetical protein
MNSKSTVIPSDSKKKLDGRQSTYSKKSIPTKSLKMNDLEDNNFASSGNKRNNGLRKIYGSRIITSPNKSLASSKRESCLLPSVYISKDIKPID